MSMARGCLVGMKPFQFRQLANLMVGAHLPKVVVQCARNEGGLTLRVSSAADIVDSDGRERSAKSISPVQTEADEAAFGSRDDKIHGCEMTRAACDRNAKFLLPLCLAVRMPLPRNIRMRSQPGTSWLLQRRATISRSAFFTDQTEMDALTALEEACAWKDVLKSV